MFYRNILQKDCGQFEIHHKYSNILVKFGKSELDTIILKQKAMAKLISLYDDLENYIIANQEFQTSLKPLTDTPMNELATKMLRYTSLADVGPMASVAGVFADELLAEANSYVDWAFIENGGDIALRNITDSLITAYPGNSGIKERIILSLPPGCWGVASSSGKFGHSLSFGQADLVTVIAENANKADSFVTAIANQVVHGCDPLELLDKYKDLIAVLIVWNDKMYYKGEFELSFADNIPKHPRFNKV